jgi:hypothetical protein
VFTLNRAVNTGEELEVFVNNVQQEPGVGKSYTATGTTLTFDAAPSSGTGNVYVIYRGLAEVTRRLEHDPNAALAATTGTFSGAFTSPGIDDNATSTAMTLDASGNLLVGTTNTDPAFNNVTGQSMASTGQLQVTRDGGTAALFNRKTSDGEIVSFRKDGGTVGVIGTRSGNLQIGTDDVGLEFHDTDNTIYPANVTTQALPDGTISFGSASSRFNNLYLSGGVYLGGTGSANHLDDYEEGTWTPVARSANGDASVTTTVNSATYTKVGNLVNVRCYIEISVTSVGTGNAQITGLPFTNNGGYTPFTSTHETFAGGTGQGWVQSTSTIMEFLNANSISPLDIIGTGTKYAMISLTYMTNS